MASIDNSSVHTVHKPCGEHKNVNDQKEFSCAIFIDLKKALKIGFVLEYVCTTKCNNSEFRT